MLRGDQIGRRGVCGVQSADPWRAPEKSETRHYLIITLKSSSPSWLPFVDRYLFDLIKEQGERSFLWLLWNCSAFHRESSLNYKTEMNGKLLTAPDSTKRKKKALNSSSNGLTIGNIQEWVPSSREIMKDTRWSLAWAEGGHFRKPRLPLTPSHHYKGWWCYTNTVPRALCGGVTNPRKKRPSLPLNQFVFRGNPEAPPVETYHWPDKCHVINLNQSPARNRTLWLTEMNQGPQQGLPLDGASLLEAALGFWKAGFLEEVEVLLGRRGAAEVGGNRC